MPKKILVIDDEELLIRTMNRLLEKSGYEVYTAKNADDVVIKARGKFISRAVDVAEVAAKRFLENAVAVSDIKIDSEGFKSDEGRDVRVSTIEITLSKNRQ